MASKVPARQKTPLPRSQEQGQPDSAPCTTLARQANECPRFPAGEVEGEQGWMAFLATEHHGNHAGQWSSLVERDREHAKKKPNHARSAYLIQDLHLFLHYQAFSPLRVKRMLSCSSPWGGSTHSLCRAMPRAAREHTPAEHPKPRRAGSNPGLPAAFLGLFPITDLFSPPACEHPFPQPGRKGIWLEVSRGSTWRSNQMAFTALLSCPEY